MKKVNGYWYPKDSSARKPAELLLCANKEGECQLIIEDMPVSFVGYLDGLMVSDRVGNIRRKITLADGSVFETKENDRLDAILKTNKHQASSVGILHTLETRWKWITAALVLTLAFAFSFFYWGLPWGANKLAHTMPIAATQKIGSGALEVMDKIIFDKSTLPAKRQEALRQHFQALSQQLSDATSYRFAFHFRHMMDLPNAMALPSGDIIVTDKLIAIAKNQQEIDAVVLHEIGHVVHRHGLQHVIQSTFVSVLLASVMGDVSGSSDILVAFPAFLLQNQYTQHHETDADEYAFKNMMALNIDPKHFASIMQRMMEDDNEAANVSTNKMPIDGATETETAKKSVSSYFSSHPVTDERIKRALEYSVQFK